MNLLEIIDKLHLILFNKRNTQFGPANINEKFREIQGPFCFHKPALVFRWAQSLGYSVLKYIFIDHQSYQRACRITCW